MGKTLKRGVDIVAASIALVAASPVMAVIAVAVKLDVGSPVLFRQERPGRGGVPFELVKFRTMRAGSGEDHERLTRVGRILRSTSLDELPELWNVCRGDMSLVGPRPLLTEYLPLYTETQARRHEVRPGITGLAQVRGRNLLEWEERFALDVEYVERQSFLLDCRILAETIRAVVTARGISAEDHATAEKFAGSSSEAGPKSRNSSTRLHLRP